MENKLNFVYEDTAQFIDYIINDYDFYSTLIETMKNGDSTVTMNKKQLLKKIDENWISAIENALPSLDYCIRNPMRSLKETEKVMPIELSKNINAKSIRHLAQHTNFISSVEGDVITPSKILNVFRDETIETYENKFVYTLIDRLFSFVHRRYSKLKEVGQDEDSTVLSFTSAFDDENTTAKVSFSIELLNKKSGGSGDITKGTSWERVQRICGILSDYLNSSMAQELRGKFIRPPIMRTNAITKNKDLRVCLELWQFIESYDKIGYEIVVNESAENPKQEYIKQLYSLLALQYVSFKHNIDSALEETEKVERRSEMPFQPKFVPTFNEHEMEEYNVFDVQLHKYVNITKSSARKKLTDSELQIRQAIEDALAADKKLVQMAKEEKARQEKLELKKKKRGTKRKKAGARPRGYKKRDRK